MNIEIVSGSGRTDSVTYRLALHLQQALREKTKHNVNILDVREARFPDLEEGVFSSVANTPKVLKPVAQRMFDADAFILVTPEYNGSYTPMLKNLFDHFPKQVHKPFGIVSGSPGGLGGIRACLSLQLLILALFGIPSPYMLVTPQVNQKFDEEGNLIDLAFQGAIDNFIAEFLWLAERLRVS